MKIHPIILTLLLAALSSTAYSQSTDLPTFSVSPGQVTEASVALTADGPRLRMNFISEKRIEFADFTQHNLKKKVKIVVNDKLAEEVVIQDHMMGGINGSYRRFTRRGTRLCKSPNRQITAA